MRSSPTPDAIAAASLILFRSAADRGPPEILMVERAPTLAFAGGAWVFPGGRVDPGDRTMAGGSDANLDDRAGRIAAIRETIEEVGLAAGIEPTPDMATTRRLRRDVGAALPFGAALAQAGRTCDLARLLPFARWCPRHPATRRYDTRFYIAEHDAATDDAAPDGAEIVRTVWTTAAAALRCDDAGDRPTIFPTRRLLERLARFATFAEARADAVRRPVRTVTPWIEERAGVPYLCIDTDLGYPVTAEPLSRVRRG